MTELPKTVPAALLAKLQEMGIDTSNPVYDPEGFPKGSVQFGAAVVAPFPAGGKLSDIEGVANGKYAPLGVMSSMTIGDKEVTLDAILDDVFDKIFSKAPPSGIDGLMQAIFGNMGKPYKFEDEGIVAEPIPEPEVAAKSDAFDTYKGYKPPLPRAERPGVGVKGGIMRPPVDHPAPKPVTEGMFATTDNGVVLRELGLSIVHIHRGDNPKAGMTIAYRKPNRYHSNVPAETIELSTAIVHPNDRFDRKIGTATAIKNFQAGRTIILPLIRGRTIPETLEMYFEPVATR